MDLLDPDVRRTLALIIIFAMIVLLVFAYTRHKIRQKQDREKRRRNWR